MSENSMVVSGGNTEVQMGSGSMSGPAVPANFSGKWSDMASDLANIAKEMKGPEAPAQPVVQPPQAVVTPPVIEAPKPVATQPQTAPQAASPAAVVPSVAEVPEKFRGADGKLDQEKLLKSYASAEKELGRKANEVNALKANTVAPGTTQAAPVVTAPAAQTGNLTPLELQVARDVYNSGAGFSEAQAIAIARTQVRLADAASGMAREAALGEVSQLREAQAEQRQQSELHSLAKSFPEVLTPQGYEALVKVRQENPWLNASPEPWKAAALFHLGQKGLTGQAGTVSIPIPTGAQPGQPLPVTPSGPVSNPIQLNTRDQIEAHVKTLSPAQEKEFWAKALPGMKWDVPNTMFKGL